MTVAPAGACLVGVSVVVACLGKVGVVVTCLIVKGKTLQEIDSVTRNRTNIRCQLFFISFFLPNIHSI